MENYDKGNNVEPDIRLCELPFTNLPASIIWMKVKPSSKMSSLIEYALKSIKENETLVWTGFGPAIGKTISCAEILKRRITNLNQITKIGYHKCEEYWNSKTGELDSLKVVRNVPVIHILLSTQPINHKDKSFQSETQMLK